MTLGLNLGCQSLSSHFDLLSKDLHQQYHFLHVFLFDVCWHGYTSEIKRATLQICGEWKQTFWDGPVKSHPPRDCMMIGSQSHAVQSLQNLSHVCTYRASWWTNYTATCRKMLRKRS